MAGLQKVPTQSPVVEYAVDAAFAMKHLVLAAAVRKEVSLVSLVVEPGQDASV